MSGTLDPAALRTLQIIEHSEGTRTTRGYPGTAAVVVSVQNFAGEIVPVDSRTREASTGPMAEATHFLTPVDSIADLESPTLRREAYSVLDVVTNEEWEIAGVLAYPGKVMEVALVQKAPRTA